MKQIMLGRLYDTEKAFLLGEGTVESTGYFKKTEKLYVTKNNRFFVQADIEKVTGEFDEKLQRESYLENINETTALRKCEQFSVSLEIILKYFQVEEA